MPSQWHGAVPLLSAGLDARAVDGKDACKRCLAKVTTCECPTSYVYRYLLRVPLLANLQISFSYYLPYLHYCTTALLYYTSMYNTPPPSTLTAHCSLSPGTLVPGTRGVR